MLAQLCSILVNLYLPKDAHATKTEDFLIQFGSKEDQEDYHPPTAGKQFYPTANAEAEVMIQNLLATFGGRDLRAQKPPRAAPREA